tara:strand:- start:4979 stop:5635 length:657 start_codon:yes stop_codon:yes gene_type:complete
MHKSISNLIEIEKKIYSKNKDKDLKTNIIAVSKTFSINDIKPLINHGHIHFGENKVQEAQEKWQEIKKINVNIKLHMIGKLQTNKVKQSVKLFDYIHSVDSLKLAKKISSEQKKIDKNLKLFIQINFNNEEQKSGINLKNFSDFFSVCNNDLKLHIVGIMCIPPMNLDASIYFKKMQELKKRFNLQNLSMGMSSDYLSAVEFESNFVRIGTKIFGYRN